DGMEVKHAKQQMSAKQRQLGELAAMLKEVAPDDKERLQEAERALQEANELLEFQENMQRERQEREAKAEADRAALEETLASGEATFFSRSRGGRWRKGETSGDRLHVVSITPDCDGDALVLKVKPVGNACHLKRISCFGEEDAPGLGRLGRLEATIDQRTSADPEGSWTARLMAEGPKRAAQKVGEEGVEVVGHHVGGF
ncbi:phosphoribosyl-ATP diphosphatase, partial [uncultured Alcanivorax sp.]|uniref:phosphoribosyl-ATP diphosphatase n=1 Tax=uncultured Alcanivorax sp. TaxID=191215 RepID=UPI00261388D2